MKKRIEFISNFTAAGEAKSIKHIVYIGVKSPYTDGSTMNFLNDNTVVHHFNTMCEAKKAFTPAAIKNYFISINTSTI